MINQFTPWTLFVDAGIIAALLLIGKLIRVKVKSVQKFFIPPSLIAGFLALMAGPNGFDILPLSIYTGTYAGILIAFIFGSLPFSSDKSKGDRSNIGRMWAYSQGGMLMQWIVGGGLGFFILRYIWPQLDNAFGVSMPTGFCGGHGTAAAIGEAFGNFGNDEMLTLAMTAATFGIISSVILGMVFVKWGTRKGHTSFLADFDNLPEELRVGLIPEENRKSMGTCTSSSISIDSLTLNFIVITFVAIGGYGISQGVSYFYPQLKLPVFCCSFIFGMMLSYLFRKVQAERYLCHKTIGHLSGTFTDFLVVCGIASIKLSVVLEYIVPLSVLLFTGLIATFIYVFLIARWMMKDYWFEKALFTWGWYTGTMAMGIALLRVVDPDTRSRCMEDYALAYLFIAPVEIALVTFAPLAFINGFGALFIGICFIAFIMIMAIAYIKGWFNSALRVTKPVLIILIFLIFSTTTHAQKLIPSVSFSVDVKSMISKIDSLTSSRQEGYKPIIGISTSVQESKTSVNTVYIKAVVRAGGIPVLLPALQQPEIMNRVLDNIDGIVMTGGADIHPLLYNEEPYSELGKVQPDRDVNDLIWLHLAMKHNIPILGICRGEQLINVALGGTLYQDLPSQYKANPIKHLQSMPGSIGSHTVYIKKGSYLYDILKKDKIIVNSFHHQAVREPAENLNISAQASDGVVEAIEGFPHYNILGVQFHPEYMACENRDSIFILIFNDLISRAKLYRENGE